MLCCVATTAVRTQATSSALLVDRAAAMRYRAGVVAETQGVREASASARLHAVPLGQGVNGRP